MSLAALIRNMSAAGAPPEAIALAVEAIEAAEAKIAEGRAKAAARKRAERERARQSRDSHATVTDEPLSPAPKVPPHTPLPNPTPMPGDTQPRARKGWACPDGVEEQHWADFLANRRTKRLTNNLTAYRGQIKALEQFSDDEWPPGRLVQFAAERGWGSINDPRTSPYAQPRQFRHEQTPGIGRTVAAAQSVIADIRAARARTG